MIPKKIHLYWGKNKPLSYMKYLTVVSFSKLNPDWQIFVYYPKNINKEIKWDGFEQKKYCPVGKDYFDDLANIKNVSLVETDFKLAKEISEVHKSDLLRLSLLSSVGGLWSDFDIFYTSPVDKLFNKFEKKDTLVCYHYNCHNIGFLASAGDNKFFKQLFDMCVNSINKIDNLQYQTIGRDLFTSFFKYNKKNIDDFSEKYECKIDNIPFTTVYPFDWRQIELIFGKHSNLFENTVGIHWFAGAEKTSEYENIVTEENIKAFDNFLLKLMAGINE